MNNRSTKAKFLIVGLIAGAFLAIGIGAHAISILSPIQGGTGSSSTPAIGNILYGTTGGVYLPINLTAGTNVTITTSSNSLTITAGTNAAITISGLTSSTFAITCGTGCSVTTSTPPNAINITNTGVTSLTGTTNQVSVSNATGSVTLSLPSTVSVNNLNASTTLVVVGTSTLTGNVFIGGTLNVTSSATFQATSTHIGNLILKSALASSQCLNSDGSAIVGATTCVTSVASGTGISVSAANGAVTINLVTPVSVGNGGTGTSTAPTDAQYLGANGSTPAWKSLVAGTSITLTTSTTSTVINSTASGGSSTSTLWVTWNQTVTRTNTTTFNVADASNGSSSDSIFTHGLVLKWLEGGTTRWAMVTSSTYSNSSSTVSVIGDNIATTFSSTSTLQYSIEKVRSFQFSYAGTIGATASDTMGHYQAPFDMKLFGISCYTGTAGTTNSTTFGVTNKSSSTATCSVASGATSSVDNAITTSGFTASSTSIFSADINAIQTTAAVDGYITVFYAPFWNKVIQ